MRPKNSLNNQRGVAPVLLLAIVGVLVFLVISSLAPFSGKLFSSVFSKPASQAAGPAQTVSNKIIWQGKQWNVSGVNMPWYNWGCDFGCNGGGGVSSTKSTIGPRFSQIKGTGMHVVRWWVFPDANPWQITVDGSGKPTGINPAVYADFDAALQLADQYDLYYDFVLFSGATSPRLSWMSDPTQRAALGQVLGTLFAHYKNNPRIMSWEIYNEPEFQIWNNQIPQDITVSTAQVIADSVHANSDALVTIGTGFADGIPIWNSVNLDFYSPHWYDPMSSGVYCLRCNDYQYYKNLFGITKPIVIGETYTGTNTPDDLQKWTDFYNKGYAGAWSWSLFPEKTSDQLGINLNAATTFASTHGDLGPQLQIASPSPSSSPTPSPTVSPSPLPSPVAGNAVAITNFAFTPGNLIVHVGDTVTWTNNSTGNHTVTADINGQFSSGNVVPGGTYNVTFQQTGTFNYHCTIHPNMIGAVTVLPNPSPSPSPSSSSKPGDIVPPHDQVDIFDYNQLLTDFGKSGSNLISNIDKSGTSANTVDIFDYNLLLTNFGK